MWPTCRDIGHEVGLLFLPIRKQRERLRQPGTGQPQGAHRVEAAEGADLDLWPPRVLG